MRMRNSMMRIMMTTTGMEWNGQVSAIPCLNQVIKMAMRRKTRTITKNKAITTQTRRI
jgi:hypothetical protein